MRLQLSWRGTFNGYIDEMTLWNRSMNQGETRALRFLDRGLNGIVVPRVLFIWSLFLSDRTHGHYVKRFSPARLIARQR